MKNFEMSQEQLDNLMKACKPVPMIALQCGTPASPQENANNAWKALGEELGFDHMTVQPISGKGTRFFKAISIVKCKGVELGGGDFTGCNATSGDCPACGE